MNHPYASAPDYALWRRAFAGKRPADVDLVNIFPLKITMADKVATAGSCFAQHISRYLWQAGFSVLITESAHPLLNEDEHAAFNYGVYTARYGNIYTSRQLLQLFQRALGRFHPADDCWQSGETVIDPYRPTIQPGGYASRAEFAADRRQHLAAVRRAMEELDVLVFTLGLTELWVNRADGAAYPLCPGVAGGTYDPQQHAFVNLTVDDVVADMTGAIALLREVNPKARVILTVSPVPLVATAEDRHVQVSTTYSKSVLRVAAEMLTARLPEVFYFPSYEIVTGNFSRGSYFADDLRSVREEGVQHVMALFFRHATEGAPAIGVRNAVGTLAPRRDEFLDRMQAVADALCDEELLDPSSRRQGRAQGLATNPAAAVRRLWARLRG